MVRMVRTSNGSVPHRSNFQLWLRRVVQRVPVEGRDGAQRRAGVRKDCFLLLGRREGDIDREDRGRHGEAKQIHRQGPEHLAVLPVDDRVRVPECRAAHLRDVGEVAVLADRLPLADVAYHDSAAEHLNGIDWAG